MGAKERRKKQLIEPRLQWRFAVIFLTCSGLATLVQAVVVSYLLMRVAEGLPSDGLLLREHLLDILMASLLVTVLLLTPLILAVGISSTHKVFGPLYRFRVYLTQLAAGEHPNPCKIREGDELQDFCELLNRATEPLRRAPAGDAPAKEVERAA